ncbi:Hypothetical predicted protein [Xyrichtys novacula]|uniref:Uncharacterized protein n=1 Tax=Xyrichtys novacula TaxID=13765 RepID=A0AAV1FQM0_XYRNO|nr:Hypothetical predicted protein [Xyrichtys novacula]
MAGFISPIVQLGRMIGFLFYGVLSVDSAPDSRKKNEAVSEDGTPERKSDRDLRLHGDEVRRNAGWLGGIRCRIH